MPERASGGGESGASTSAATGQNLATRLGGHACAETVPAFASDIRRLECLFHLNLKNLPNKREECGSKSYVRHVAHPLFSPPSFKKGRES